LKCLTQPHGLRAESKILFVIWISTLAGSLAFDGVSTGLTATGY
jgi:hypothetical protein